MLKNSTTIKSKYKPYRSLQKSQNEPSTAGCLVVFMMLADITVNAYVICQKATEKTPLCLLSCFQNNRQIDRK